MPTDIRMYNCAFGDCFKITQNNPATNTRQVLFVDFGIHRSCKNNPVGWKDQRYQDIANDIYQTDPLNILHNNVDFLLSHYHADHYSGLDHLPTGWKFNNVYIPDVWNDKINIEVINLLLLRDVYTTAALDNGRSLIDFLIKICHTTGRIHFVQRGLTFQNDTYTALAPSVDPINQEAADVLTHIDIEGDNNVSAHITDMAERLRHVVQDMANITPEARQQQSIPQLNDLEEELKLLAAQITPNTAVQQKLSKFANRINIIFHNRTPGDRNILFTGDAEGDEKPFGRNQWQLIEHNTDGKVALHEHYHVIKIPHHGTKPYYHDFTAKSIAGTVYLIPNGKKDDWRIDERYSQTANNRNCTVYCSSSTACKAFAGRCNCRNGHIVPEHPNPYQDI